VDATERRTLEDYLRHQASTDSLTGLANHRRLFEVLYAEISRSTRTGREFSLMLLDLDGLKQVNDRLGHLAGDRALIRLGQGLLSVHRHRGAPRRGRVCPGPAGNRRKRLHIGRTANLRTSGERSRRAGPFCECGNCQSSARRRYHRNTFSIADRELYAMKDKHPGAVRAAYASFSS
jgi:Diguanylate cyclase, GGDEF domain